MLHPMRHPAAAEPLFGILRSGNFATARQEADLKRWGVTLMRLGSGGDLAIETPWMGQLLWLRTKWRMVKELRGQSCTVSRSRTANGGQRIVITQN